MEIILLLLVLVILLLVFKSLKQTGQAIREVKDQLDHLKKQIATRETVAETRDAPVRASLPQITEPVNTPAPVFLEPEEKQPVPNQPAPEPVQRISWFTGWLRNNPDIEKFIGENLINKVGIAVLVLGIAFFVKYAIDQEWINQIGRVCIGLLCGGLLMAFAHRLRQDYHAFSSVLVGGGLTVFYFSIAFAFHQYQLLSQAAAFAIMVVITAFAIILSVLYNRIELGILATIGGFITPFLVSTGAGNYLVLFTYLTILNAGLIGLAYYKRWRILNFLGFVLTQIFYLGFVYYQTGSPGFSYPGVFIFGAVFYGMFIVMNVIHHAGHGSPLKIFDFILLFSVNLFFYGAGISLLQGMGCPDYFGLFTAMLGLINLALAYLFFRRSGVDQHFIYLLIGITLSFISLAAPVQLRGHFITLFWAAELVVLIWLYQKSRIRLMKVASLLISGMMMISLLMDWFAVYFNKQNPLPVIFNKGFMTSFCCAGAMLAAHMLWRREKQGEFSPGIPNAIVRTFYLTAAICLFFLSGMLETALQFITRFPGTGLQSVFLQLYTVAFLVGLFGMLKKFRASTSPWLILVLPALLFIYYLLNTGGVYRCELKLLAGEQYPGYFLGNWISLALLLLLAVNTIMRVRNGRLLKEKSVSVFSWIIASAILIILSIELMHVLLWLNYTGPGSTNRINNVYDRAGLSILWALSAFSMIWLGMKYRFKPLRILALVVFGITLLKLFIYDIRNISQGGKIIAFILLGVLLLVISFMYQRLKKVIIDDGHHSV